MDTENKSLITKEVHMKQSKYVSKKPDDKGFVQYNQDETEIWRILYERQMKIVQNRCCEEFIQGIHDLGLKADHIPQIPEVNKRLSALTGWEIAPVPALIDFQHFFELMSERKFPAATFIRNRDDLDYLQEPDLFHEVFGHCPLLTLQPYADFMHAYGQLGLEANHQDRVMLARLYWFTIEFGLIQTTKGLRIYGGGILSSSAETVYALESKVPVRKSLDCIDAFRTPYRIDIFQPIYFIINNFLDLYHLAQEDLMNYIQQARALGMHAPSYPPKPSTDDK